MGEAAKVVVGRLAEVRFVDVNTGIVLSTHNVPYGSTSVSYTHLFVVGNETHIIVVYDLFNFVVTFLYQCLFFFRDNNITQVE